MSREQYRVVDTITGVTQAPIMPASNTYARAIDIERGGKMTISPSATPYTPAQLRDLLALDSRSLVVSRNGKDLYRGQFTERSWDESKGLLTLDHSDLRYATGKRTTMGTNSYSSNLPVVPPATEPDDSLRLKDMTAASMVPFLFWSTMEGPTTNYDMPIYLESGKITLGRAQAAVAAGTDKRDWYDYEFQFIDDALTELAKLGVETDLQPRVRNGNSEILLRYGTLTGGTYECVMTADKPWLFGLSVREDSRERSNVLYAVGKGSERDMRVTTSRTDPDVPAMERAENYKDIDDLAVLKNHSDADLALRRNPIEQWEISMLADSSALGGPRIEDMLLGSTIRMAFRGHAWITDGWHDMRLIGFSGDMGPTVKLSVQPIGA